MRCCSEDRSGCSKLDLPSVALGGKGRSRSFIPTSLGMVRCWRWDNAHQRSHAKPAQVWQCWLLCSLSLGERISQRTLFHNGKKKKFCPLAIVISIAAICKSRHCCLSRVSCGHALSATSADTNPPAYVEISDACMAQWTKQTRWRCASENGPKVICSPAVWANPTFSEKELEITVMASAYLRKHLNAFNLSNKLNSLPEGQNPKGLI